MTIELTQNDTAPLEVQVTDDRNRPVPLSSATASFHMKQRSGAKLVVRACTVLDEATGLVRVDWETDDLDTPGLYDSEVEVTLAGARKTYPSALIDVRRELA